jgi:hypothetical protein
LALAPIVLFVYNRPLHTQKTIQSLQRNSLASESELFIYADAPKTAADAGAVDKVHEIIDAVEGFKRVTVHKKSSNTGLAKSIIAGVTEIIDEYGRAIVMEDDLVSSRWFLKFMNDALDRYENEASIFSVCGFTIPIRIPGSYQYDSYLSYRAHSWGWGTWKDRWQKADWNVSGYARLKESESDIARFNRGGTDMFNMLTMQIEGRIDSWAIRWAFTHYENDAMAVYPKTAKINNIGMDGSGIHCKTDERFVIPLDEETSEFSFCPVGNVDKMITRAFYNFWSAGTKTRLLRYIRGKLRRKR